MRHLTQIALLAGALLAPGIAAAAPPPAGAPAFDPQQLPAIEGSIARYTLTPRGDVDGFILTDGTEVRFPPHLSTQLVFVAKPGDMVTVHGLRALGIPLVDAVSITNDATGQTVTDAGGPPGPRPPRGGGTQFVATGRVTMVLHGPRGDVDGAVLEDGTMLRLPPPEAARFSALLTPGQTVSAQGPGLKSPLGTVIDVREIGASPDQLSEVAPPARPPHGPHGRRPPPPG
jgi:hypothetical protein